MAEGAGCKVQGVRCRVDWGAIYSGEAGGGGASGWGLAGVVRRTCGGTLSVSTGGKSKLPPDPRLRTSFGLRPGRPTLLDLVEGAISGDLIKLNFIQFQKWNLGIWPDLTACGTSPSQGY